MAGTAPNSGTDHDQLGLPAAPFFSVVIVYEEVAAGQRAMRLIRDLASGNESHTGYEPSLWKLAMLLVPKFRELAAGEAAAADMVIVAAQDRETLPVALQGWFESWPPRRPANRGALVALLELTDESVEVRGETLMFLRRAAAQTEMDFFVQSFQPPARSPGLTFEQITQRAVVVSSVLDGILHHPAPAPHWDRGE